MSQEESQEELFNRLLTDLEKSPEGIPNSFLAAIKLPRPSLQLAGLSRSCSSHDIIKVMKSGIFHKGGIKGIPDKKGGYKSWRLKDLAFFILMATSILLEEELNEIMAELWEREHRKRKRGDISAIDNIIKEIDQLGLDRPIGRRNFNKLVNARKYLHDIKSDLLSKPSPSCPKDLKNEKDRIDLLIDLFQKQVHPKTAETIISEAVSKLLWELIKTVAEPSAIRQRIYREKLTQII